MDKLEKKKSDTSKFFKQIYYKEKITTETLKLLIKKSLKK